MDQQDVPGLLPLIRRADMESALDEDKLSHFLSRIELARGSAPGMSRWRKRLFVATWRITADAAEYFRLPRDQTLGHGLTDRAVAASLARPHGPYITAPCPAAVPGSASAGRDVPGAACDHVRYRPR